MEEIARANREFTDLSELANSVFLLDRNARRNKYGDG